MDSWTINWAAIAAIWAIVLSIGQIVGTAFIFTLRRQADEIKSKSATTEAISNLKLHISEAVDGSDKRTRKSLNESAETIMKEIDKLESGDRHLERRVTVLEQTVAFAPKAADLQQLRGEINVLATNVAKQQGAQEENNRILRMIHEFMMERSTK